MKKILSYFLTLNIALFLSISYVNAECSYTDKATLNKIAANVKVNYEIQSEEVDSTTLYGEMEGEVDPMIDLKYINLNILNISSEIYIEQTETTTGEVKTYSISDATEGAITERFDDLSFIRKYTFKVYGSDASACPGESLKTIYLTLPKQNEYADRTICSEQPDFYLCKEFITVDDIDEDSFQTKIQNYTAGTIDETGEEVAEDSPWYKDVLNFLNDYKYYIGGGVLVTVAGVVVIRRIRTKKQRELGL